MTQSGHRYRKTLCACYSTPKNLPFELHKNCTKTTQKLQTNWEDFMQSKTIFVVGVSVAVLSIAAAASAEPGVMAVSPSEMKWSPQGGLALPGLEQVTLIGDPSKPGPYTIRLKFPAGFKVAPHTHPDSREVTVLSGTWYTGYGEKAEAANLKELPAGSFYTEPANIAHYVEIREPTVVQVSGTGPSGRKFVGPDAPK
jgi:quercetin dioxygenase-like cupin family protein